MITGLRAYFYTYHRLLKGSNYNIIDVKDNLSQYTDSKLSGM
ncbi:protein of unknown function [Brochothrix thermosphacta]|uniref:Uncharacterized protein n=1 Tax=Brochothrix thermosphacta TaxID=2756 RepID=A0A2X0S2Q1_BROTH|nr:hypothetical protein FM106_09410 [Brachybacterium faecium]SOC06144.1 hypothetical protein BTH160X_130080 [Brochothrix thermosphacta]SPN71157.1 protein of unknown function [Brochothrix thermosphacta]SPN75833.1 hypothetical protein BTEBP_30144 [Brochothrix thermosphacta]SPP25963.1 hypothetical protein BTBSAS_10199 [Brochothrix thermosphacta]